MFRTITSQPDAKPGKYADEKSLWGKAHHHEMGEDTIKGIQPTTQEAFNGAYGEKREQIRQPPCQVHLGTDSCDFKTEAKATQLGMPSDFVKQMPVRDRASAQASSFAVS
jgi:hypothetical protein